MCPTILYSGASISANSVGTAVIFYYHPPRLVNVWNQMASDASQEFNLTACGMVQAHKSSRDIDYLRSLLAESLSDELNQPRNNITNLFEPDSG